MNNEDFVLSSKEKHLSHEIINAQFFPWIEKNFDLRSYIITMPSRSGRQENLIIKHIFSLEQKLNRETKIGLRTYDNIYNAWETGILSSAPSYRLWRHEKCGDIFKAIAYRQKDSLIAAWFDLTGGLLNSRLLDIKNRVNTQFAVNSLMFITLAIDNVRGLSSHHYAKIVYQQKNSIEEKVAATTEMLAKIVATENKKYLEPCIEPYVYKHGRTTYALFGFNVKAL